MTYLTDKGKADVDPL